MPRFARAFFACCIRASETRLHLPPRFAHRCPKIFTPSLRNMEMSSSSSTSSDGNQSITADSDLRELQIPSTNEDTISVQDGHKPGHRTEAAAAQNGELLNARAYQVEMFELSLQKNIIVAMPTGSGKTQVAILRIRAEVETTPPDKLSWFLAPTVALCQQQHAVLVQQMPAVQIKLLTGAIIDKWSNTKTWDDFLNDTRIVVSTYQLLYDAISHAFVRFDRLTLLVVDEAHNCRGNSPVAKMMDRYRERKEQGLVVPAILGLTASPIMNSRLDGIEEIERKMDAVCRTPAIHREELTSVVKLPEMQCVSYTSLSEPMPLSSYTPSMLSLQEVLGQVERDIFNDPEVLQLKAKNSERSRAELEPMLIKKSTYAITEMRTFVRKSHEIRRQLGPWAVDRFIMQGIAQHQGPLDDPFLFQQGRFKKDYVSGWLSRVQTSSNPTSGLCLSEKMQTLVRVLLESPADARGIVFVDQTATVSMLAQVLPLIPELKTRFQVGMMVGTSQSSKRAQILGELHRKLGDTHLEKFRHGTLNLLVATTVLEEGIDVPACNLVVCFDPPANLKSFIQRRGRARKGTARLILLVDDETDQDKHEKWLHLEREMKKRYQDEVRQATELEAEEVAEVSPFRINETGAQLDFDQATSHLQHVCTHLSLRPDTDSTPYYLIHRTGSATSRQTQMAATVVLPASLPAELRRFKSEGVWYAEKNAKKDAAFVAFKALYDAGLVDDHLMPFQSIDGPVQEVLPGLMEARECFNPWVEIAQAWRAEPVPPIVTRALRLHREDGTLLSEALLSIPYNIPYILPFQLHWSSNTTLTASLDDAVQEATNVFSKPDHSRLVLGLAFGHRTKIQDLQHVVHISLPPNIDPPAENNPAWVTAHDVQTERRKQFLIRDEYDSPFFFESWVRKISDDTPLRGTAKQYRSVHADEPWLILKKWPRQGDFLHPTPTSVLPNSASPRSLTYRPLGKCRQDSIPVETVQLGTVLPSVFHVIETRLIAQKLCTTLLEDVRLEDLSQVVTAISSSKANETTNYQRLEFLGDTILKFLTTITLSANRPHYPEGYLTMAKSNIVSNAHLCRVTLRSGLDEYILTKPFAGRKWAPDYVDDLITESKAAGPQTRMVSTKTLADVIESLAGAAFLEGGWEKATAYLRRMMPEVDFRTPDDACTILQSHRPVSHEINTSLAPLEELCGYTFKNKMLLAEAMTHSSFSGFCESPTPSSPTSVSSSSTASTGCASLERLEFLGDAVLDIVIMQQLWFQAEDKTIEASQKKKPLSHQQMHLLRTAVINADLLGLLAMEWGIMQERSEIFPAGSDKIVKTSTKLPLWKFMRHLNPTIPLKQQIAEHRYQEGRDGILSALLGNRISSPAAANAAQDAKVYPWAALAHLQIPKTFSDLVEALLGAVWTDSKSIEQCTAVAKKIGILRILRRLVDDEVDVLHPKNKLGEFIRDRKVRYEVAVRGSGPDRNNSGGGVDEVLTAGPEDTVMGGTGDPLSPPSGDDGKHLDVTASNPDSATLAPSFADDVPMAVQAHLSRADQYTCKVFVHEEFVIEVGGGLSREEIVTKGADEAYKVLLARWGPAGPPPSTKAALAKVAATS